MVYYIIEKTPKLRVFPNQFIYNVYNFYKMSAPTSNKNTLLNTVKLYIFPSLVTILAMMIWRDVTELRSDVKALLAQSSVDKTKIEQLEKEVRFLQQSVFGLKSTHTTYIPKIYHDKFFKHEEFFDETKYLPQNQIL